MMGFHDFAGSLIVHACGGFAGLAGAIASAHVSDDTARKGSRFRSRHTLLTFASASSC